MVYYNLSGYNSDMLLVGIFSWWYGSGLIRCVKNIGYQIDYLFELFSIKRMISTFFAPFRQISANATGVSFDAKFAAFVDRTISRFIGAFMRLFMIIFGVISICAALLFGLIGLILWVILPIVPIVSVIGWLFL